MPAAMPAAMSAATPSVRPLGWWPPRLHWRVSPFSTDVVVKTVKEAAGTPGAAATEATAASGNGYPPIDASPPYGCASGGELSAAIETSTHPLTGAASAANAARPPPGPHIAPATRNRTPHPPPPRPEYGPDGRLLPLKLSSAAVIAAWANAPPPMPAYPQWDAGKGGYIGILLQWLDEGRLALRDTAPGVKAVKAVRMAM
ncbi:hypothetical protein MMPV_009686 [Pyropia vietnamensis]